MRMVTTGVSARDLFRLKSLSQPNAAGGSYYFVENRVDEASNGYRAQLNSVDDQGHQRVVATVGEQNVQPAITATTVFFAAKLPDQVAQLYQVPLTGGTPSCVATPGEAVKTVLAAADGHSIYFKTTATTEKPKLPNTEKFPVTRHVGRLINKADGYGWLPEKVTYRLRRYLPTSGALEELFQTPYDFDLTSVSADGHLVTYLQDDQPDNDRDFAHGAYCLDVTTGQTSHLTASLPAGQFADATLAPNGQTVALVGHDGQYGSQTISNLYLADRATGRLTNCTAELAADLVPDFAGDFTQQVGGKLVRWLDNDRVAVVAAFHAHSQLYVGNAAGLHLVNDTAQQIVDFDVVAANKVVLAVSRQTLPSALVTVTLDDQQERVVYDPNAAYERNHHFAQPRHFDYQAGDGQALEGWYLPAQTQAPQTPVLLYVHGGPHANYGETFFYEFQVHASLGYGVVFVNPRGSTSYGQDFENAVNGHYGEGDYTDVMSGLDYALEHFTELDPDRQYIAGGSYGGFMTLWTIGHTHRFAAAVSQRSVTNWISLFGTSDIGFRFNPVELGLDLFDEDGVAAYWRQSPLAYAPQVTTPVRLLHGEWDMRCPISQSEEYFTAVRRAGVDADFIRYPQSFHGVSRDGLPSLRLQRIADMDAWFTAHPTVQKDAPQN